MPVIFSATVSADSVKPSPNSVLLGTINNKAIFASVIFAIYSQKTVRGNTISVNTVQINTNVLKEGNKKFSELFKKEEAEKKQ